MKTKRILGLIVGALLGVSTWAQLDWNLGGNLVSLGTDYLGCNAASTFPLHLRTIPNLSIDFSTSDLLRMRLHPIQSSNINGYGAGSITQDGFLGLSDQPVFFAGAPGPFSRLHLVDGAGTVAPAVFASEFGFRKWMRNGVTFSGNSDQGYIGQKYKMQGQSQLVDQTDMVLQWSSDPEGEVGPDHLRFIFTGGRNTTTNPTTGWNSEEGLEAMRILPVDEFQSFVGVGDFFAGGVEPSERLDVLDRTIRIRRLVPDYQNDALTRVMMTDVNGRVHWRDIATWPQTPSPGAGCDWEIDASLNRIYTAWRGVGTNASCPEVDWKVGIGVTHPGYKLDVLHDAANGGGSGGLRVRFTGPSTGWSYGMKSELTPSSGGILANAAGVHSLVSGGTTECWGVLSNATATTATSVSLGGATATANATSGSITTAYGTRSLVVTNPSATLTTAYGSYGETQGAGLATKAYGMYGYGQRGSQETYGGYFWGNGPLGTTTTYGVYGRATGTGANWAGFFTGPISVAGTIYPSDEHLKTEIQDLQGPTELLMQLRPKSYYYRHEEYPQMDLPDGLRYGFIAQDVQEAFPQFTTPVHQPEELDAAGNVVFASVDYLGLNTSDIIPLLVGSVQEQQAQVDAMNAAQTEHTDELQELRYRMQELESMLAACCARGDAEGLRGAETTTGTLTSDAEADSKLRIQPNPFSEPPTVYYTLDRAGRMQLIANSADGKELNVLQEATLEAGDYQYAWDTNALAPGMYYVTLFLEGKPIVKKAVKVTR